VDATANLARDHVDNAARGGLVARQLRAVRRRGSRTQSPEIRTRCGNVVYVLVMTSRRSAGFPRERSGCRRRSARGARAATGHR